MNEPVLYLCDRRACERCSPECHLTLDIKHAKNFELGEDGITYVEKESLRAIFRLNGTISAEAKEKLRADLLRQVNDGGVIVCDRFVEPLLLGDMKVVEKEEE